MNSADKPLAPAALSFEVADGDTYYRELCKSIPRARNRIVIAAMILLSGEKTGELLRLVAKALERGVQVHILLDNYTRLKHYDVVPKASHRPRLAETLRTLETLQAAGARTYYYGRLGLNPYKGRCHVKLTVVDDTAYTFGGLNFYDEGLASTDFLLCVRHAGLGDWLEGLVGRIGTTEPPLADQEVRLDPHSSILFDGGRAKHSIIYERACELVAQAKRVYYVSQMAPSGQLARLLSETDTTLYFNRPEQMIIPSRYSQAYDQRKYHLANSYTGTQYIHAKFMLFKLSGGRRAVLSGSNNFSYRGVAYGTQEIGLYASSPQLFSQLYRFMESRVL